MTRQLFWSMIAILCLAVWSGVQQVTINVFHARENRLITELEAKLARFERMASVKGPGVIAPAFVADIMERIEALEEGDIRILHDNAVGPDYLVDQSMGPEEKNER